MAGEHVSYFARTKKFVDREIFCDYLIQHFNNDKEKEKKYGYISMGGPFLVDHELIRSKFQLAGQLSIDNAEFLIPRQEFNREHDQINCKHLDTEELIKTFDEVTAEIVGAQNFIVWLDFADANRRAKQLDEFRHLIDKLCPGDIIRLTLNSSIHSLSGYNAPVNQEQKQVLMRSDINDQLAEIGDVQIPNNKYINKNTFSKYLLKAVKRICLDHTSSNPKQLIAPIFNTNYNDGMHEMLCITCVVVEDECLDEYLQETNLANWPYFGGDWEKINKIAFPELSIKERALLEAALDNHQQPHLACENLEFRLYAENDINIQSMREFSEFRTHIPIINLSKFNS